MIRVIAGSVKGRRLKIPKGQTVRPTSDKVRGAIFNILGDKIIGADVLDLFSGSGALGIESLSRGAGSCTFVDNDPRCIKIIRENLENCGFSGKVVRGLKILDKGSFNIVFADPPYGKDMARNLLSELDSCSILKNFSLVVIEHSKRDVIEEPLSWQKIKDRRYGDTAISIYEKHNRNIPWHI